MTYGGSCSRCGRYLKLLFNSWYCDCEDDEAGLFFGIVHSLDLEDYTDYIPQGNSVYLYEEMDEARGITESFLGFTLLRIWLTPDEISSWSSSEGLTAWEAPRNLPFEVVQ